MRPALRQILVHLDATAASAGRLPMARRLAGSLGAELAALYAITPGFLEMPIAPEAGPMLAETLREVDEERRQRARAAFDQEMLRPGPPAAWAETEALPTGRAFAQQALHADLLVLGQRDPADECARCVPPDFVSSVLLESGRPAVVVPYACDARAIGDSVALAWKESAEAAHALDAALPFLQRAAQVHVLAWGRQEPGHVRGAALDLEHYLRVHGVQASWHRESAEPEPLGEQLLSRACDLGADLLVMGCYGHSRAREWILGGATRTVLRSMTVPVLMAH